ncbi:MAG: undecaprenyldiphospho-muramoylpentapeptide beta-N-acetylglucosaminyltransferase [Thermodesulfobacteriota bacterium]
MKLIIAGGGTGGHLFPGLAVARALRQLDSGASVLFVGTRQGIEARVIPDTEFPIRYITARGLRRTGLVNTLRGITEIPRGIVQSISILREFRPDAVMGVGGYASGPTLVAAWLMGIPSAIQEQNSLMGTTNQVLTRVVDRIFTSWEVTTPAPPPAKTLMVGNPVRMDLMDGPGLPRQEGKFNVLVFGGSQGARSINEAIVHNLDGFGEFKQRIGLVHQTGRDVAPQVAEAYKTAGIDADVREFIDEMGAAYQWADLVVCRSGASTLAELTAFGKPAILIPYPYAIGDHQTSNALVLDAAGAARMVRDQNLKNGTLVREITELAGKPDLLRAMAEKSRKIGRPDAARTIARELSKMGCGHSR